MKEESGDEAAGSRGHICPYRNFVELPDSDDGPPLRVACGTDRRFCRKCREDIDDEGAAIGIVLDELDMGF
jgi:hypothetical protein